jgi:FRG domain-containing protein
MRHYGLPTRLLDWTESVSVAAFFATRPDTDDSIPAAIWMLSPGHLNRVTVGNFIPFLTHQAISSVVESAFWPDRPLNLPTMAVMAPRNDPRLVAQVANFTIHGSRQPLEVREDTDRFLARVQIPADAKGRIREDISMLGMRLANLFPDLEHLAEELSELVAIDDGA